MNVDHIQRVIDAIEGAVTDPNPIMGFNMRWFVMAGVRDNTGHSCGSAGCIGGWNHIVKHGTAPSPSGGGYVNDLIAEVGIDFGITNLDANALCMPSVPMKYWQFITPAQAVHVLTRLRDTGVVDWSDVTVVVPDDHIDDPRDRVGGSAA